MKPIELTRIRNNGYQFEETITFQKEIYENIKNNRKQKA